MGTCMQVSQWSLTQPAKVQGRGHKPLNGCLFCLCPAETRAESSSSKPLLLHPHAGRRHGGQGAQVPPPGHRHGGKPEADCPVLAEGRPGRESDGHGSLSPSHAFGWLLKGKGQRARTSPPTCPVMVPLAFDLGHCEEKGGRSVIKTSCHWSPSNLCVRMRPLFRRPLPAECQREAAGMGFHCVLSVSAALDRAPSAYQC